MPLDLEEYIDAEVVEKSEYKQLKKELHRKWGALQRQLIGKKVAVAVLLEGWDAAGKGNLINEMVMPLDPRHYKVTSENNNLEGSDQKPYLWKYWVDSAKGGQVQIYDRAWYSPLLDECIIDKRLKKQSLDSKLLDIDKFERQLNDANILVIKIFLHISKEEQEKRFKSLLKDENSAFRVSKNDLKRHELYEIYQQGYEQIFSHDTLTLNPWKIVPSVNHKYAVLNIYQELISRLEERLNGDWPYSKTGFTIKTSSQDNLLGEVNLNQSLERAEYKAQLKKSQKEIQQLELQLYRKKIPVAMVFEGWDAAGKGGAIRRLTQKLDPRSYRVIPVAAPTQEELAHHYLWRFWKYLPSPGCVTIYDRSWYGRVLVERVENLCREDEWQRAYREINEMEAYIQNEGVLLLKFWMHIDQAEQLRRFEERKNEAYKQWKITDEDWRNREKWDRYELAVNDMLIHCNSEANPWTIIEGNNKLFARLKVLKIVIAALKKRLNQ